MFSLRCALYFSTLNCIYLWHYPGCNSHQS